MSGVYAQAPVAEGLPEYITPGKVYPVAEDGAVGFVALDDDRVRISCLWIGCPHLHGGNWTRTEVSA